MQEAERRIEEARRTGAEVLHLDFWAEDYPEEMLFELLMGGITLS